MTTNSDIRGKRIPLNRKLFSCIDKELYAPIDMPGSVYFADDALFKDEHGNEHDMAFFYSEHIPLVCPNHGGENIFCRPYIEYSSSLGFYCKECDISYWSLSKQEIPCRECGVPVSHGSLGLYGICCQCDYSSESTGIDLSKADLIL